MNIKCGCNFNLIHRLDFVFLYAIRVRLSILFIITNKLQ